MQFIPSFHFDPPVQKLSNEWCLKAIDACYYQSNNKNLLQGKNLKEIEEYATGEFSMRPFIKMFKSLDTKQKAQRDPSVPKEELEKAMDGFGIDWSPLPLIPTKLNSAISVVQKIPIEISCVATDPLAATKKKNDIMFLQSKPTFENDLQGLADEMNIGKVDLGTTQHSSIPFSSSPYGLDLNEPDELEVFINLLYKLSVEAAYETALQQFKDLKNLEQIKLMEIKDHYYFGISANRTERNPISGLPDIEYVYPDNISCQDSKLPDYGDNTHRFTHARITALELFNAFGDEIGSEKDLAEIINGNKGYCRCNNRSIIDEKDFGTFKVDLVLCEIKSVDWIGIGRKRNKRKTKFFTTDPKLASEKLWGQNTYIFWWLKNTDQTFGRHTLDYSHREKGQECFQGFSTNIYRSQKKSAVELAIRENKKAQIADIKLQHALVESLPRGRSIDLAFLRGAITGLKEKQTDYTIQDLINLAFERNRIIGDSEGFENKIQNGYKPVEDITGGLNLTELSGYFETIKNCKANISEFTGINDQLAGFGTNQEGLIGLQKLLINSSLNTLYYVNDALKNQYTKVLTAWGNLIKQAIEEGGKTKEAIASIIGQAKANLIDAIDEMSLHSIGIFVHIGQREEEKAKFQDSMNRAKEKGMLNIADEWMLLGIQNPRDAYALLAVKEKQFYKRQAIKDQQAFQQRQQLIQQTGDQQAQLQDKETEGNIKEIYAKGDVESKIQSLMNSLGLQRDQFNVIAKKMLQQDRAQQQTDKILKQLMTKSDLAQQSAMSSNSF